LSRLGLTSCERYAKARPSQVIHSQGGRPAKRLAIEIDALGRHLGFMRNTLSLVIGIVALLLAAIAFIPLLGWANWFIVPLAVIGAGLGATSDKTSGRNLNIVVIAIGVVRLMIGGGIF
jgi:membrane protein DedA with SNARE-associated domain